MDALGGLEEQRAVSPEVCQAKRPWHRRCDEGASRVAYGVLADEYVTALKAVQGMTAWSLEALLEIKP